MKSTGRGRGWNGRGRKVDPRRAAWMERMGLSYAKPWRQMNMRMMDQLEACKDDEARRIILGVSEKREEEK